MLCRLILHMFLPASPFSRMELTLQQRQRTFSIKRYHIILGVWLLLLHLAMSEIWLDFCHFIPSLYFALSSFPEHVVVGLNKACMLTNFICRQLFAHVDNIIIFSVSSLPNEEILLFFFCFFCVEKVNFI